VSLQRRHAYKKDSARGAVSGTVHATGVMGIGLGGMGSTGCSGEACRLASGAAKGAREGRRAGWVAG
jgi:hypothetical protein